MHAKGGVDVWGAWHAMRATQRRVWMRALGGLQCLSHSPLTAAEAGERSAILLEAASTTAPCIIPRLLIVEFARTHAPREGPRPPHRRLWWAATWLEVEDIADMMSRIAQKSGESLQVDVRVVVTRSVTCHWQYKRRGSTTMC